MIRHPQFAVRRGPRQASPPGPRPLPGQPPAAPRQPIRSRSSGGFTLVELLVTITVIGILAAISMGALQVARESARAARTKALITKLDRVITARYESYQTRRVPIKTTGIAPKVAARMRLDGLRDLIRMEMPERWNDISDGPYLHSSGVQIDPPALLLRYREQYQPTGVPDPLPTGEYAPAECLYMIIATGSPDAMESFTQADVGDVDGDGFPEFIDGWGNPIMFLRWAPGFTPESEIQTGDPENDHDPFDTRRLDSTAYRLIPLVYSAGRDKQYDIELNKTYHYQGDPYASGAGTPVDEDGDGMNHTDNITNHAMTNPESI